MFLSTIIIRSSIAVIVQVSSLDEQICFGYEVKAEAIDKLCHDIHMYMMSAVESVEEKKNIPMITEEHLLN